MLQVDIEADMVLVHFAPWYRNQMRLELGESVRSIVDAAEDLDIRADFIPEAEATKKYLQRGFGNSYDFGQTA